MINIVQNINILWIFMILPILFKFPCYSWIIIFLVLSWNWEGPSPYLWRFCLLLTIYYCQADSSWLIQEFLPCFLALISWKKEMHKDETSWHELVLKLSWSLPPAFHIIWNLSCDNISLSFSVFLGTLLVRLWNILIITFLNISSYEFIPQIYWSALGTLFYALTLLKMKKYCNTV